MVFESLTIHNFGVYRGRHQVALANEAGNGRKAKPVTLLGAMNGSGKTTLLDAIQLALFGKTASQSSRNGLGYSEYLRSTINRNSDPHDGASVELGMRLLRDGREEHITVQRYWHVDSGNVKESLQILRNKELDRFATDNWDQVVDEICPRGIANLFFFDGEKVKELADPLLAGEAIRSGFHALLGLDMVDKLITDLSVVEKRLLKDQKSSEQQLAIVQAEKECADLADLADSSWQEIGAKTNNIEELQKRRLALQEKFNRLGGGLAERQDQLEKDRDALKLEIEKGHSNMRDISAGLAPLCLLEDAIQDIYAQAEFELEQGNNRIILGSLADRDRMIREQAKESGLSSAQLEILVRLFEKDREIRERQIDEDSVYLQENARVLHSYTRGQAAQVRTDLARIVSDVELAEKTLIGIERSLEAKPEDDAIRKISDDLAENQRAIDQLQGALTLLREQHAVQRTQFEKKSAEIESLYAMQADVEIKNRTNVRVMIHSERVRKTMKIFRRALLDKHLHVLEDLVLESFQQLLRKPNFLSRVEIASDTFALKLFDGNRRYIDSAKLSAGERQLLAVAVVWGLAKAAGRPLPTVIDTPLGRLDSEHRDNVVRYYFPNASHQVILLSTDTEIDHKYYELLKPSVGLEYQILYDPSRLASQFVPGYFRS